MEKQKDIREIIMLFKRRKKTFFITLSSILLLSIIVAFVIPPVYVSKSTILIETQQVPSEYVKTSSASYVEERLSTITQQILSSSKLLDIINQFNLYPGMMKNSAKEGVAEKMRNDIKLETISTLDLSKDSPGVIKDPKSKETTVAFRLSYESDEPATAQKVANALASLYLKENFRTRNERAAGTTEFLNSQLNELKRQMDDYAQRLSTLKSAHIGELPEQNAIVVQAVDRLSRDLDQLNAQLRAAQQRKTYLVGQLSITDKFTSDPFRRDRPAESNPDERLDALRNELINSQTTLTDQHPDIIRLKREIRELESQLSKENNKKMLTGRKTVNPAYVTLKTQIETASLEIRSLQQESGQVRSQLVANQGRLFRAPLIEGEYKKLVNEYETAKSKYTEMMNKLMESKVSQGIEQSQQAERFTIIEPAAFPEVPDRPNRLKIILTGLFLSLFGGIALIALQESLDQSIKTAEDLTKITKSPVLSVIPFIERKDPKSPRSKGKVWFRASTKGAM